MIQLWLSGCFLIVSAVIIALRLWRDWGLESSYADVPIRRLLGVEAWRGMRRALPCLAAVAGSLGIVGLSIAISGEASVVTAVAALGVLFGTAMGVSVFLFNQPSGVVPPAMRSERGYARRHRDRRRPARRFRRL